jgi:signal transduction histidine kinase
MTDELWPLRAQLSSLQSLLTLSKLMGDSGDQQRIAELAGTAVPSLARCQLVGVELAGAGWGPVGPAGGSAAALAEVSGVLRRLGGHGGAVAAPALGLSWVWAYPMQSAAGHAGFLVVAAEAEPPAEERFVLQSLAQQTGVALINARLQADERAAAAAALEAKREADRANTAKSEFLSRMSHELRTPLNAILGFGQLLEIDDLSEEQAESVDHILRAGRHLLGLINEVLDLARIESGHLALSPEAVGVHEVIKDTIDLIWPLAAERALRIQAPAAPECTWTVQADRQRLKQVLLNLTSNAVSTTATAAASASPATPATTAASASRSPIPVRASPPTSCRGCSPSSTALAPSTARSRAPAWAWCWPSGWPRRWAAPSPWPASRARGPPSPSSSAWPWSPPDRRQLP